MTDAGQTSREDSVQEDNEQLVDGLATFVNQGREDPEEIVMAVGETHRWLQQRLFDRVVKPIIIALATQGTDRRNQRAVRECEAIVEEMDWEPSLYESDDRHRR
jgi:hypothetical protein